MGEEILLDENGIMEEPLMVTPAEPEVTEEKPKKGKRSLKKVEETEETELINCLRNEKISVRFIERNDERYNKNHPYYGNMADGSTVTFTVPLLRNGNYKNPLTKEEKDFLEAIMGLEPNALSIYNKHDNYWENRQVVVEKRGTVLDLSTPLGYIDYKILLANSDTICPSIDVLKNRPLASYRFVLVSDKQVYSASVERASIKAKCWKTYGKFENDAKVLRTLIHTLTGKTADEGAQLEFLQATVVDLIEEDAQRFLNAATDPLLTFKVLIREAVSAGVIDRRGDYYYYAGDPLCSKNEDPTLTIAARYISNPRNQEILFSIQNKMK